MVLRTLKSAPTFTAGIKKKKINGVSFVQIYFFGNSLLPGRRRRLLYELPFLPNVLARARYIYFRQLTGRLFSGLARRDKNRILPENIFPDSIRLSILFSINHHKNAEYEINKTITYTNACPGICLGTGT
jgi:hypothetical protein